MRTNNNHFHIVVEDSSRVPYLRRKMYKIFTMLLASDPQSYSQALWSMFIYLQHTVYSETATQL